MSSVIMVHMRPPLESMPLLISYGHVSLADISAACCSCGSCSVDTPIKGFCVAAFDLVKVLTFTEGADKQSDVHAHARIQPLDFMSLVDICRSC